MIEKTINIKGRDEAGNIIDIPVKFRSSAAAPLVYRMKFGRDIMADMADLAKSMRSAEKAAKITAARKGTEMTESEKAEAFYSTADLTLFLQVAYVFAYCADNTIEKDIFRWLDNFEMFSIHAVLPELMELWNMNNMGLSNPKKK